MLNSTIRQSRLSIAGVSAGLVGLVRLVGLIGFVVLVGLAEVDGLVLIVDIVGPVELAGRVRLVAMFFVRLLLFLLVALVDLASGGLCAS